MIPLISNEPREGEPNNIILSSLVSLSTSSYGNSNSTMVSSNVFKGNVVLLGTSLIGLISNIISETSEYKRPSYTWYVKLSKPK